MLLLATVLWAAPACAHRAPKVDAPLGRVVVYRNGVAYFERRATVDGSFSIEVPRGRVDDFLKSLTVVDLSDGSPLSVSYETPRASSSRSVSMEIVLPSGKRNVLITYVTESPAWKPSYRVMLEDDGKAVLQSLAVVDNVSNEAWEGVRVGVGTTSALSFRYDLHSVRMVERETVDEGRLLAKAPPKGGSAYAVDGEEKRVIANLAEDDLQPAAGQSYSMEEFRDIPIGNSPGRDFTAVVESSASGSSDSAGISIAGTTAAESRYRVDGASMNSPARGRGKKRKKKSSVHGAPASAPPAPPRESPLERLAGQLSSSSERIRVEGFRLAHETDASAALRRANTLRENLIAEGIPAQRIEVAEGRGAVDDPNEVLRVTAIDSGPEMTQAVGEGDDDAPRGSALFVADKPLSLERGHSAMVTLLEKPTKARRVYLFDPTSERGSTQFAFNAVRIQNPTGHTLDAGPVTVYAKEQYLGEGLADAIPPHANALVPYALDRMIRLKTEDETQDDIQRILDVQRGVATTDTERVRSTTISLHNRGTEDATVYVRYRVTSGWKLRDQPKGTEQYGDDVLVPVRVRAGGRASLTLAETMPLQSVLNLRSTKDLVIVKRYLASGDAPDAVARQLASLVDAHEKAAELQEKLLTAAEKVAALRTRTRELRDQLLLLRKTKRAQSLSSHLAKRMREVSDELDDALVEVNELENQRLQANIELSTVVAELSVETDKMAARE